MNRIAGKQYLAFQGVPYAKPPIGDLRFRVLNFFHSTNNTSGLQLFADLNYRLPDRYQTGQEFLMPQLKEVHALRLEQLVQKIVCT